MRKLFIVLGIIAAVLAVVFSVLPVSNLAFVPGIAALVFGLIAFFLAQKQNQSKKLIQLIFILTIIALSLTSYKAIFNETTIGNTEITIIPKTTTSKLSFTHWI